VHILVHQRRQLLPLLSSFLYINQSPVVKLSFWNTPRILIETMVEVPSSLTVDFSIHPHVHLQTAISVSVYRYAGIHENWHELPGQSLQCYILRDFSRQVCLGDSFPPNISEKIIAIQTIMHFSVWKGPLGMSHVTHENRQKLPAAQALQRTEK
jgi:hypothetical protein